MIAWYWVFAGLPVGALLLWGAREWWTRRLRKGVVPRPGRYLVRWVHPDGGQRELYTGPDLKQAKYQYYEATPRAGATMEFWDGPDCRGTRAS